MRMLIVAVVIVASSGCHLMESDPEVRKQKIAAERFEDCMDETLATFGPVKIATSAQRLKAAEICGSITSPAAAPARESAAP
jgi:hypothetical protein